MYIHLLTFITGWCVSGYGNEMEIREVESFYEHTTDISDANSSVQWSLMCFPTFHNYYQKTIASREKTTSGISVYIFLIGEWNACFFSSVLRQNHIALSEYIYIHTY